MVSGFPGLNTRAKVLASLIYAGAAEAKISVYSSASVV
jgi:hypothetical protein